MTPETYHRYIKSTKWQTRRAEWYNKYHKTCHACGAKKDIQLHHLTYETVGNEPDTDLVSLCQRCHSLVHHYHDEVGGSLRKRTEQAIRVIKQGHSLMGEQPISRKRDRQSERPKPVSNLTPTPEKQQAQKQTRSQRKRQHAVSKAVVSKQGDIPQSHGTLDRMEMPTRWGGLPIVFIKKPVSKKS